MHILTSLHTPASYITDLFGCILVELWKAHFQNIQPWTESRQSKKKTDSVPKWDPSHNGTCCSYAFFFLMYVLLEVLLTVSGSWHDRSAQTNRFTCTEEKWSKTTDAEDVFCKHHAISCIYQPQIAIKFWSTAGMSPKTWIWAGIFALPVPLSQSQWVFT